VINWARFVEREGFLIIRRGLMRQPEPQVYAETPFPPLPRTPFLIPPTPPRISSHQSEGGKKNFLPDLLFTGVRIPKNHGNKENERIYENL
jgi:hypothetical protein